MIELKNDLSQCTTIPTFLKSSQSYLKENNLIYAAQINPDAFVGWVFPKLVADRLKKYESLASKYGCTIKSDELHDCGSAKDVISLISNALKYMPLIAHSKLPSFERLKNQGETILSKDRAEHQVIRELHIGLLNMMPDAALEATERQFFRLCWPFKPNCSVLYAPFFSF